MTDTRWGFESEQPKILVLGATGTMGWQSAALFASHGFQVKMLGRSSDASSKAHQRASLKVRPKENRELLSTGGYDSLESDVAAADIVFEALAENFELKKSFYQRVVPHLKKNGVVATVTSGLSISSLAEGLGEHFENAFVGFHLFNPPQLIRGTEVIAGKKSSPDLVKKISQWGEQSLGRVVVQAKDVPGFIGNRVGFRLLNHAAKLAGEYNPWWVDRVMSVSGRLLPPLATIDLVGWDVHQAIVDNISKQCDGDEARRFELPAYFETLLAEGFLGKKNNRGYFIKNDEGQRLCLDVARGEYRVIPEDDAELDAFISGVKALAGDDKHRDVPSFIFSQESTPGRIAQGLISEYIAYSLNSVGKLCENLDALDTIMACGFSWVPPGAFIDALGRDEARIQLERHGCRLSEDAEKLLDQERLWNRSEPDVWRFFK